MSVADRPTLRGSPVVAAPGKIFLCGEYAVLDGAPAVVAAVSRFAVGQYIPGNEPESLFVAEAVQAAVNSLGERGAALPGGSVMIDSSAFSIEGRKLGLGSSAAVTAASVAAVLEMAGLAVSANRELCFSLAEGAHRAAQGGAGSGADVAVAVHGGLIQYRRPTGGYPIIERRRALTDLHTVVFAEGKPSSTPDLIRAVRAFGDRDPAEYAAVMRPLREQAELFAEALSGGNLGALLESAGAYGAGLAELGNRSGAPIVTPRFEIAADLAINLEGVAKPSGAGGGDIGIGLFPEAAAAATFAARLRELGLHVVDVALEPNGVHRRLPSGIL